MAKVSLKGIRKVYDKSVIAVEDFNIEINDREFVVLVGPSGCGKSTTLRMVAGLEEISEGELYINDKKVNDMPPKDRDIAMVFQNYALYPHMSVFENMAFAMKLRKVPKQEIKEKVENAAKILDIQDLLNRKPRALSGGQRQRVAIGRAIVRNPKVFLMDEPLSNLDAKLRNQMRAEIIMLRKRIDTTFIYVTHDQTEAMTLGDRIVIMDKGLIQQIGTPQEVFNTPSNTFVAGFIGMPQMNFFESELHIIEGLYQARLFGLMIPLNDVTQQALKQKNIPSGCIVTLGVRPEHLLLEHTYKTRGDSYAPDGFISARLVVSELLGSEINLHLIVDAGKEEKAVVIRTQATAFSDKLPALDEVRVRFSLSPDLIHIFDKDSGENLIKPYLQKS